MIACIIKSVLNNLPNSVENVWCTQRLTGSTLIYGQMFLVGDLNKPNKKKKDRSVLLVHIDTQCRHQVCCVGYRGFCLMKWPSSEVPLSQTLQLWSTAEPAVFPLRKHRRKSCCHLWFVGHGVKKSDSTHTVLLEERCTSLKLIYHISHQRLLLSLVVTSTSDSSRHFPLEYLSADLATT